MKIRASLRLRVAVGIALLTTLIISAHSVILYSGIDALDVDLVDRIVEEELQYFIDKHRKDPAHVKSTASDKLRGYVMRGVDDPSLPTYLRDLKPDTDELTVDNKHFHVLARDLPEGRFIMLYDISHHEERDVQFIVWLAAGTLMALLLAAGLGYWAAGLLVRPVHDLAERVGALGTDHPETPLADAYADEEVRRLALAFDVYRQKVFEFVRREQEFTANVSHELRTPLTAIRTSCELILQEPGLDDTTRRRLTAIDRSAVRMEDTARALLFLARAGGESLLEDASVQECVAEAAEPLLALMAQKGIDFEPAIDPAAVIRVDRHALYLVVSNLLSNAARYTDHGLIRIDFRDGRLSIKDSGSGIAAGELPRLFERYYRGGQSDTGDGMGLGLAIVKRICDRFDWTLEVASTPGTGTSVVVGFPLPT